MHRIRRYGLLHPASRLEIEELHLSIAVALGQLHRLLCTEEIAQAQPPKMSCQSCGGPVISWVYSPPKTLDRLLQNATACVVWLSVRAVSVNARKQTLATNFKSFPRSKQPSESHIIYCTIDSNATQSAFKRGLIVVQDH